MTLTTGILVFVIVWWLVFFTVLPWGVQAQYDDPDMQEGTEPGAPIRTLLPRKAAITTLIAIVLWFVIDFMLSRGFLL